MQVGATITLPQADLNLCFRPFVYGVQIEPVQRLRTHAGRKRGFSRDLRVGRIEEAVHTHSLPRAAPATREQPLRDRRWDPLL